MSTSEETPAVRPAAPPAGLAIASLVLGILSVCLSFLLIGGVLGVIGLVLGFRHLRRHAHLRVMAGWGEALSIIGILATIALAVVYYSTYRFLRTAMETTTSGTETLARWEGVEAPDLTFTTLDGATITLSQLRGKRVVLDFWATWCAPCRKEIPHFSRLANESSAGDLVVIGLSSEKESVLRRFVEQEKIPYPIAAVRGLPRPYNSIRALPTTIFIDRRGVIQTVLTGYHDFGALEEKALQADGEEAPRSAPAEPASGLKASDTPLTVVPAWSTEIVGATALCTGDWNGDDTPEVLVATRSKRLHVVDLDGREVETVPLPDTFQRIECGRHGAEGARLVGYGMPGAPVTVVQRSGDTAWTVGTSLGGVNGAHWGDLDGDGTDELIVGYNGFTGLHAVSADGRVLWKVTDIGNVWSQAVLPARDGRPAQVFATEAGGSVKAYDGLGALVRSVRPDHLYCTRIAAALPDREGAVQLVSIAQSTSSGGAHTVAFDPSGTVAWRTTGVTGVDAVRREPAAAGDLDGDGRLEWAFIEGSGDLVLATPAGERLAAIPRQAGVDAFAIAGAPGSRALLVTIRSGAIEAYRLDPGVPAESGGRPASASLSD